MHQINAIGARLFVISKTFLMLHFTTQSPVNQDTAEAQNGRLFRFLSAGNTIHVFHPAKRILRIGFLNSRIPEIRKQLKKEGKDVFKRWIRAENLEGKLTSVVEYSMFPFEH